MTKLFLLPESGLIYGLSEDARYIADSIAERRETAERALAVLPPQSASMESKRSRATTRWVDRVMTLICWSALSLVLDAFAGYAAGLYPAASQNPTHQADPASAPTDATSQQH